MESVIVTSAIRRLCRPEIDRLSINRRKQILAVAANFRVFDASTLWKVPTGSLRQTGYR
jgi:hypothetical protein